MATYINDNETEHMYHMKLTKPDEVIKFINLQHPELKDLCAYDPIKKELISGDETVDFHFDPFHNVLRIAISNDL